MMPPNEVPGTVRNGFLRGLLTRAGGTRSTEFKTDAPRTHTHIKAALLLVFLWLLAFTVFYPGLDGKYFADDFLFYFSPPPPTPLYYFDHQNPNRLDLYRPVEATFLVLVQHFWDMNTIPIHITQLTLHVVLSAMIFFSIARLGFSTLQALIGSCYFLVSQANVHAVLSNDTFSQVFGTLSGYSSLLLLSAFLFPYKMGSSRPRRLYYLASVCFFAVSLACKETSTSFFLMVVLIIAASKYSVQPKYDVIRKSFAQMLPFMLVLAMYFAVRSSLGLGGASFGHGRFELSIGQNIPLNVLMLTFQAFNVLSSVDIFVDLKSNLFAVPTVAAITSIILLTVTVIGLGHERHRGTSILIGCLAVLGLFPVVLLNNVSELYIYNSMPPISLLIGVGIGWIFRNSQKTLTKCAVALFLLSLLVLNVVAARQKAHLVSYNGDQAERFVRIIESYADAIPPDGTLFLVSAGSPRVSYSIFLVRGFDFIELGLPLVRQRLGTPDLKIAVVDSSVLRNVKPDNAVALVYSQELDTVVLYRNAGK